MDIMDSVDFGPPYDDEDADIIIRSSDLVDFRLHRLFLTKASPVFKAVLSQASDSPLLPEGYAGPPIRRERAGELLVLCLQETSDTLESLLSVIVPVPPSIPDALDSVIPVLAAAQTYQMHNALVHIRRLSSRSSGNPFRAYSLSWRFGLKEESLIALALSMDRPLTVEGLGKDLCLFSGPALMELLNCRVRGREAVQEGLRQFRTLRAATVWSQCSSGDSLADLCKKQPPKKRLAAPVPNAIAASPSLPTLVPVKHNKGKSGKKLVSPPWLEKFLSSCEDDLAALNRKQLYLMFHDHTVHEHEDGTICQHCGQGVSGVAIERIWAIIEDVVSDSLRNDPDILMLHSKDALPPTAAPVVPVRAFGEPFNSAGADLVLRSSDFVDFHAYKASLAAASPFFRDMFTLPQASDPPDDSMKDGRLVLPVQEDSQTLERLLTFLMHVSPTVQSLTFADAVNVLSATQKYQMDGLTASIRGFLRDPQVVGPTYITPGSAFAAYVLACRQHLAAEALQAARCTLDAPFSLETCAEDLRLASGDILYALSQYRIRCRDVALQALADTCPSFESSNWTQNHDNSGWGRLGSHCDGERQRISLPEGYSRAGDILPPIPAWLAAHIDAMAEGLKSGALPPSPNKVADISSFHRAFESHGNCQYCALAYRRSGSDEVWISLAEKIDKAIQQVRLCVPW
ncbi:hypothetical protein FA95DRAFT_335108 [Auriscalpium vulgare]|uniref:Uncharacterized protein n=1 Tax=Auriscalpium vulgare TaxID=40419 RepID=A0ACB8RID9_9AGAM|nr:hypothetical protein FA95DRAFT_335108 [Auriscalpium vulgare]